MKIIHTLTIRDSIYPSSRMNIHFRVTLVKQLVLAACLCVRSVAVNGTRNESYTLIAEREANAVNVVRG